MPEFLKNSNDIKGIFDEGINILFDFISEQLERLQRNGLLQQVVGDTIS